MSGIGVTAPASEELRRRAAEIVARPDYELKPHPSNLDWLYDLGWEVLDWILTPLDWIFRITDGLPEVVRWLIILVLVVILSLLVWHILYSLVQAVQSPRRLLKLELDALKRRADPDEFERQAEAAAARHDYITAVRLLFRAGVLRLEKFEDKPNRPGTTNRELLRRYQREPGLAESLRRFVDTIDRKWYGEEQCLPNDYAACRLAHEVLCRYVRGAPMFTARNAIIAAAIFAAATIVFNALEALRAPNSNGYAADSFGTHWNGYRALFELLSESGTSVERSIGPPKTDLPTKTTLVLLVPDTSLVSTEPAYLEPLLNWVEAGGRIVAAPVFAPRKPLQFPTHKDKKKEAKLATLLDTLGVKGVSVEQHDPLDDEGHDVDEAYITAAERRRRLRVAMRRTVQDAWNPPTFKFTTVNTIVSGVFPLEASRVARLYLPAEAERHLELNKSTEASGLLEARVPGSDEPRTLAASFRRGSGEIIVLAEPALLMNMCLAHADNSVFAYDLLANGGRRVVFDEFYHGSSVRGQPLWLLTQSRYAVGAWLLLAFASLIIWRKAVVLGPPLETAPVSRRTILEYVEAMARFFQGARGSRLFVLFEVRAGALRTLGDRLGLSPADSTAENVATALARRSPDDARRFQAAVAQLNAACDRGPTCSEQEALRALQGISACL